MTHTHTYKTLFSEITYLQEVNYLQEIQKYDKKIQVILTARSYTSKFQLILCFNIDLKELKDSAIFASWGRLFQCKALKHLLPNSFFGIGGAKSVSLFLRLYALCLSLLD